MRGLQSAAVIVAVLLYISPCSAKVRDGNDLLQYCTATIGAYILYCFGYIGAIADTLLEANEADRSRFCLPPEEDEVRLRDVVVDFLRKNEPSMRRFAAPRLVTRALYEAFPCR